MNVHFSYENIAHLQNYFLYGAARRVKHSLKRRMTVCEDNGGGEDAHS